LRSPALARLGKLLALGGIAAWKRHTVAFSLAHPTTRHLAVRGGIGAQVQNLSHKTNKAAGRMPNGFIWSE